MAFTAAVDALGNAAPPRTRPGTQICARVRLYKAAFAGTSFQDCRLSHFIGCRENYPDNIGSAVAWTPRSAIVRQVEKLKQRILQEKQINMDQIAEADFPEGRSCSRTNCCGKNGTATFHQHSLPSVSPTNNFLRLSSLLQQICQIKIHFSACV